MPFHRQTHQDEEVTVEMSRDEAFRAVVSAYEKIGRVKSVQEKFGRVVGTIGSGGFNMNRADVTVRVEAVDEARSKIVLTAAAKEGLINQSTAPKAISRLLEALQ
jgi:hypothetical protein